MTRSLSQRTRALSAMVVVLLVATALRAQDIALMGDMLHYDEAYYGVDALSLLTAPRLTPFFPDNFGRESLWMYVLTPALAIFGATSFALRITALFVGVLTVAAVFRLGRVLFGWRVGVWSAASLAVLFWHVLASHQAFRALLYPLVGALAFAALWETWTAGATRRIYPATRIVGVGAQNPAPLPSYATAFWFGILAYTYIAARAWIALAAVMVGIAWASSRTMHHALRTGLTRQAPTIAIFLLMIAPLAWTFIANPALANLRGEQVAISSMGQLADNMRAWAGAWFVRGSEDVAYNLPGRPILDLPLTLLLIGGVLLWGWRDVRWKGIFVIALFAASLAPAVLTTDTLKPIRAIGVVVPLALVLGAAAEGMARRRNPSPGSLRRPSAGLRGRGKGLLDGRGKRRPYTGDAVGTPVMASVRRLIAPPHVIEAIRTLLPLLLLALAALNTSRDFAAWVRSSDLFLGMEQHLMRGIDWLRAQDEAAPIYFSPFTPDHPVIRFRASDLAARSVSAFKADECLRLAEGGADYFALTYFDPDFPNRLRPYATVSERMREDLAPPRYAVYHATPDLRVFAEVSAVWDERLSLVRVEGVPQGAAAGESIHLTFGVQRTMHASTIQQSPLPSGLTMFVHLYGDPTPYEGGPLWAQADMPLCPNSPPATWRNDEIIAQGTTLALPPDLPAGRYALALGMYESLTGTRLPVTTPDEGLDYVIAAELEVE